MNKKIISIFFLVYVCNVIVMNPMVIKLKQDGPIIKENAIIFVPSKYASLSKALEGLKENVGEQTLKEIGWMLPEEIKEKYMDTVISLWNALIDLIDKNPDSSLENQIETLSPDLQSFNFDDLYEIIKILNFFDISPLLHTACSVFAQKIDSNDMIQKVLSMDILPEIKLIIGHYIVKNPEIWSYFIKKSENKGNVTKIYDTIYEDEKYRDIWGMHCTSYNEKGDIAFCFQSNDQEARVCLYDHNAKRVTKTVTIPPFDLIFPAQGQVLDEPNYYQLSCALSPDSKKIACIGKNKENKIITIYIIDIEKDSNNNVVSYLKPELADFPLFSTFSADEGGKNLCIISNNRLFVYIIADFSKDSAQKNIAEDDLPIEYCFSRMYESNPYIILKKKDEATYKMCNIYNLAGPWENKSQFKTIELEQIIADMGNFQNRYASYPFKKSDNLVINKSRNFAFKRNKGVFGDKILLLQSKDIFNEFTYQLYFLESYAKKIYFIAIDLLPSYIKTLVNNINMQTFNFYDALYLLSLKINNWNININDWDIKTEFKDMLKDIFSTKVSSYIHQCINIQKAKNPGEYVEVSVDKKDLYSTHIESMATLFFMGAFSAGTIAILKHSKWVAAILAGMSGFLGYEYYFGGNYQPGEQKLSRARFLDTNIQKTHTMLNYLRYGLGLGTAMGLGWLASYLYKK